jgi:hypothetical protein
MGDLVLDWRDPHHWNGGRREPCRRCGHLTFLVDEYGQPCHKACAERELTELDGGGSDR